MVDRPRTGTLVRLLRLWRLYATMDFIWLIRDARQAILISICDAILGIAGITATLLIAERFAGIGPWSKLQVAFMLGYGGVVNGVLSVFGNYNIWQISRRLGRGQLDHILIQPQPVWMALLTEGFSPVSAAVLLPGLALLLWAIYRLHLALSPGWLAMAALNLAASAVIALSFTFLWGSLAFWAPRAAEEISSSAATLLFQLRSYPLDGLSAAFRGGLLSVLPVGFVAWYPCRYLLGLERGAWVGFVTPLAAFVMAGLATWLFTMGMKHYGRTGSQRYSSFGHRR